jgi:cytochrome c oxidase subunit I+III
MKTDAPELLVTTVMDAEPTSRQSAPGPTIAPFIMAVVISAMLIGGIFNPWSYPIGLLLLAIPFAMWTWPRIRSREHEIGVRSTYSFETPA